MLACQQQRRGHVAVAGSCTARHEWRRRGQQNGSQTGTASHPWGAACAAGGSWGCVAGQADGRQLPGSASCLVPGSMELWELWAAAGVKSMGSSTATAAAAAGTNRIRHCSCQQCGQRHVERKRCSTRQQQGRLPHRLKFPERGARVIQHFLGRSRLHLTSNKRRPTGRPPPDPAPCRPARPLPPQEKNIVHNGNLTIEDVYEVARVMADRSCAATFAGTVKEMLGTCVSGGWVGGGGCCTARARHGGGGSWLGWEGPTAARARHGTARHGRHGTAR